MSNFSSTDDLLENCDQSYIVAFPLRKGKDDIPFSWIQTQGTSPQWQNFNIDMKFANRRLCWKRHNKRWNQGSAASSHKTSNTSLAKNSTCRISTSDHSAKDLRVGEGVEKKLVDIVNTLNDPTHEFDRKFGMPNFSIRPKSSRRQQARVEWMEHKFRQRNSCLQKNSTCRIFLGQTDSL